VESDASGKKGGRLSIFILQEFYIFLLGVRTHGLESMYTKRVAGSSDDCQIYPCHAAFKFCNLLKMSCLFSVSDRIPDVVRIDFHNFIRYLKLVSCFTSLPGFLGSFWIHIKYTTSQLMAHRMNVFLTWGI
jgi:hypothetical protein